MEYKNQTENRAFQEMLQVAVKRLQNRSGEDLAAKSGAVFYSSRNVLEVLSFYETIEIQLPEFRMNSNMDEWHYLTLLHYLDMADGTEGSQKLITFGNLKDGLIRGTKFDRTAEQKLEKLLQDKDPEKIQKACKNLGAEFTETKADLCAVFPVLPRYPVTLKIWFADEEFPASGKTISSGSCRSLSECRRCGNSWRNFAAKIIGSIFFPLIMDQKTFQSGFDKFVNCCLNLFPVITVIAEHQSVDGKAAIHLKIKNRFCLLKGQEAV
ncbi:MAG: DUF3786 domain-containing protein [Blautia wexlerae]